MRIHLTSVLVDDQEKALRFYTEVLGFVKKRDVPVGDARWLTVVSFEDPEGTELLLEPDGHPAAGPFKQALMGPVTTAVFDDTCGNLIQIESLR
jgi:catechol 2,3-dioxygenase-like lactoylglutathione lyase family enzyme